MLTCKSGRLAAAALAVTLMGFTANTAKGQDKLVKIDGSSTVFPVTEAVAEEFQASKKGAVKVTVGISGTGGGFKKFARGEIDISNASRPISADEMKAAKENGVEYIELPICFDALTVAVNPQNTWCDTITVEELKKLWEPAAQGKITKWSQVRAGWPDEKIEIFGAGTDSGTFDYFTEAVVGKAKSSRGDYTASEDDNVLVRGIEGSKYALGYIPYAYFAQHAKRMKAVKIDWEKDQLPAMEPTMENVLAGKYNPLSRPLFIYVNKKAYETRPEVRDFADFYLDNAAALAEEVKYLPLPSGAYEAGRKRLKSLQTGTAFAGHAEIGVPVEEIMRRSPVAEPKDKPAEKK
ncbi:MAG: Protein SphX [Phycisphaerales bacterium]|nr:Protein SphX [Phycisphaerales bacterium]MCK6478193.1 PstS family phosphate ABC transporter substrate-binding protein [Phycisphaerales bacterium]